MSAVDDLLAVDGAGAGRLAQRGLLDDVDVRRCPGVGFLWDFGDIRVVIGFGGRFMLTWISADRGANEGLSNYSWTAARCDERARSGRSLEPITHHSFLRACDEAVALWALASAQFPRAHEPLLNRTTVAVLETASAFSLNARRALEVLPASEKFALTQPRWNWEPTAEGEVVRELRDAFNRIIHAQRMRVGFEQLPASLAVIDGGAVVVPYIQAETDRKKMAFIDPFALAHAFLYAALPKLETVLASGPAPTQEG